MDLSAQEVNEKQFHDAWRGYNQEEVDDFLDRIAESLDRLQRENEALHARISELEQQVSASRNTEDMLKKTLVGAQRAAEEAIAKAKARAEQVMGEAEDRAKRAEERIQARIAEGEAEVRRRTLDAERDHTQRRREFENTIDLLKAFESDLRQRLRMFLEQQLKALSTLTEMESPVPRLKVAVEETSPADRWSDDKEPAAGAGAGAPGAKPEDELSLDADLEANLDEDAGSGRRRVQDR